MNLKNLSKVLKDEPKFRYKQVEEAIYQKFVNSWDEVSNLPKKTIEELEKECPLDINGEILKSSRTNTRKAIIKLEDDSEIESVLMLNKEGKATVCISTQVGCPMKCTFCATAQMKFARNLTAVEIIEQVLFFSRILKNEGKRISNVVYMGMGEPFLNYENVMESIKILNDKDKFNIGARNISISTVGVIDGIRKLTMSKLQVNLAISLHASNEELRDKIVPINKIFTLKKVLNSADKYIEHTNRKVMFEYVMLKGVNDSDENAKELAQIMNKPLYVVNLIKYNDTGKFESSGNERIEKFMKILKDRGVNVTKRFSFGGDINSACGQLKR